MPVVAISSAETAKVADSTITELVSLGTVIELSVMVVFDVLIVPGVISSTENITGLLDETLESSKIARRGTFTLPEA